MMLGAERSSVKVGKSMKRCAVKRKMHSQDVENVQTEMCLSGQRANKDCRGKLKA